jgi:hypothetical protein
MRFKGRQPPGHGGGGQTRLAPHGGEAAFFDDLQENGDVAQQRDTDFPDYYSASCRSIRLPQV